MKKLSLGLLGSVLMWGATYAQAAPTKAGWIDGLQPLGTSTEFVNISRDGKTMPYTPANRLLFEGDKITLAKDGLVLKLVVGENTVLVKSEQAKLSDPFVVKLAGEIPSVQKNLLDWMGDRLKGKDSQRSPAKTISASARSAAPLARALSMPILEQSNAQLVGGKRDILLSWQGGTMPYRIILKQGAKETVAANISEMRHTFVGLTLQEEKIEMILEDGKGNRYVDSISIVPESRRPAMPVPLSEGRLDAEIRNRLYGEWLIEQGNDWALEALQWMGQSTDQMVLK